MRRASPRGREDRRERCLVPVAGHGLGPIVRLPVGAGTPREFLARASARLPAPATADGGALIVLAVATGGDAAVRAASFAPEPHG